MSVVPGIVAAHKVGPTPDNRVGCAALPARRNVNRYPRPKAPAERIDPKYLAAARELRDRYLEHLNGEQFNSGMILPGGKYAIERALPGAERERLALPQAA